MLHWLRCLLYRNKVLFIILVEFVILHIEFIRHNSTESREIILIITNLVNIVILFYMEKKINHKDKLVEKQKKDIKIQLEEIKSLQVLKKEAEIHALNSQINPHFLYNTIESICMRSMLNGENETAKILRYLSQLFRNMYSWRKDVSTIQEEVTLVQQYLEIQHYRYGDKLTYDIKIAKECNECELPKMTLLTLIENVCTHALEDSLNNICISISVYQIEKSIEILMNDNGSGMSQESLALLNDTIKNASIELIKNTNNIGILNTYVRLRYMYGQKICFHIESEHNQGTTIKIKIMQNEV